MVDLLGTQFINLVRLSVWLVLLTLVFVPIERLFSLQPSQYWRRDTARDVGWYFINSLAPNLLLILPTAALAWGLHGLMPDAWLHAMAGLPLWARLFLVLTVVEVGTYWGHRWSHEVPWLWRFHAVHHNPEHIHFLSNTRAHPLDMVFTRLCGLVPVYVLGLSGLSGNAGADLAPMLVVVFGTLWGFFIHANVRWRLGWVEALVSTPAFHHWHHTNDHHRDHNYAALFPWLDRVFGTHHLPNHWPPSYGIDEPLPPGMGAQLAHPFKPKASTTPIPAE